MRARKPAALAALCVCAVLAMACANTGVEAPADEDGAGSVAPGRPPLTGRALFDSAESLPPASILVVRIEDVTGSEPPFPIVARQIIDVAGETSPVSFEVDFAEADIDPDRDYSVRAFIADEGRMIQSMNGPYSVITKGNPVSDVSVRLTPVASAPERPSGT